MWISNHGLSTLKQLLRVIRGIAICTVLYVQDWIYFKAGSVTLGCLSLKYNTLQWHLYVLVCKPCMFQQCLDIYKSSCTLQAAAFNLRQRTYWEGFPSNGHPSLDIEQRGLWFQSHTLCSVWPASEPAGCPKCCLCARQSGRLRSDTIVFQKHVRPQNLLGICSHVPIHASWTYISFPCRSATKQPIFVQCNFETCDSPDDTLLTVFHECLPHFTEDPVCCHRGASWKHEMQVLKWPPAFTGTKGPDVEAGNYQEI